MSVPVSTTAECEWTAASEASWISSVSPASGQGSGQIEFRVTPNPAAVARQGDLVVNSDRLRVQQSGADCRYDVAPRLQALDAGGGSETITITTLAGCSWVASSSVPWIAISEGATGSGSGRVVLSVSPNAGTAREGGVVIAGQAWTVTQSAAVPQPCDFSVSPETQSFNTSGGPGGPIAVNTTAQCTWTATTADSWITVTSGSGTGPGIASFSVAPNPGGARTGFVAIGSRGVAVTQAGTAPCSYVIAPTSQSVDAGGGAGTPISVTTTAGCGWSAVSAASWISIVAGAAGNGSGTVQFSVAANPGAERTAAVSIAGRVLTVTQAAAPAPPPTTPPVTPPPGCSYALAPVNQGIAAAGGVAPTIAVTATAGCAWTATSTVSWLTVRSGASGAGTGTVTYEVSANPGAARSGSLAIAGQAFVVSQDGACTIALDRAAQSVSGGGVSDAVINVAAASGCGWTAASTVPWVTVTGGASGTGSGTVTFNVASNGGASSRTGAITIGGQPFTVTQDPACTYRLDPARQDVDAAGISGAVVNVTSASGCTWTAAAAVPWITVTGGGSGSGNGAVTFSVAANSGASRNGSIAIGGQTFAVSQAAFACSYAIDPSGQSIGAAGGSGAPIAVTAPASCAWTASSNAPWITIASGGNGTANGSVTFNVQVNTGAPRTGTLTVATQTFTVTQASGCTYSINSSSQSFGASGGSGTAVAVTAANGCTWTASSNASWLTVTSGGSGSGNGTVTFTVAANATPARSATLTIAGHAVAISQAGGCAYGVTPLTVSASAAGAAVNSVAVTAATGCTWSATSGASWATVTSGSSGNGNGTVQFSIAANTEAPRSTTLSIADRSVTISQGGCSYIVSASSLNFDDKRQESSVSVRTSAACAWTASVTSGASWLSVTSGSAWSGNGEVKFLMDKNNDELRSGTIAIAGQTLTVWQSGGR